MTAKIHSCLQFRLSGGPGNKLDPTMKLLDSHSKQRHCVNCLHAQSPSEYQDSLAGLREQGKEQVWIGEKLCRALKMKDVYKGTKPK